MTEDFIGGTSEEQRLVVFLHLRVIHFKKQSNADIVVKMKGQPSFYD